MKLGLLLMIIAALSFCIPIPSPKGSGSWQTLSWYYRKSKEQTILFIGSTTLVIGIAIFWIDILQRTGFFQ